MDDEDTDHWVTYGDAFSDDETEEGRMRALQFGNRRSVPAAYENRVLNEKGRPMRFHGAFTGGFSAGYFNTVGSKEGFKPKAFFSSRKARQRDVDETQKEAARPEDFMDDEDFGEFGIAPRRIKLAHEFDDTHIRDTLKTSLGGQSVIPGSDSFLKNFIIPSKGPLAERLLRRMGWRQVEGHWEIKETSEHAATIDRLKDDETEAVDCETNDYITAKTAPASYPELRFEAKVNTFGLGYSGLDPDLAMGRRRQRDSNLDQTYAGDRHPEESPAALLQRQQAMQLQSGSGFNPLAGSLHRGGIRGQAFGVGALETDDGDIYVQDRLTDYDWEIDGEEANNSEVEEDAEEAELEAARLGRFSSSSSTFSGKRRSSKQGGSGGDRVRTLDGWTAPRPIRDNGAKPPRLGKTGTLPGFIAAAAPSSSVSFEVNSMPRLPPGYMPVFNPLCVCEPSNNNNTVEAEPRKPLSGRDRQPRNLDALSRCRILEDKDSVFDLVTPTDQLRLKAAAAGLPVPVPTSVSVPTSCPPSSTSSTISLLPSTGALLKPFKTDPAKQSRFEAFQVLVRRGFTDEIAYVRCSGSVELNAEERDRELAAFQAILSAARLATASSNPVQQALPGTERDQEQASTTTPLSTRLAPHKQRLVAGLLASRFRSAGCMDISKEKIEAEQREELAKRVTVESLEIMEPKDHAVATETYGAMTRRRLTWHPDKLLCKRINVPDPHPESTYVGCPDERRLRNPFTRRGRRRLLDLIGGRNNKEFSLFDILDVNRGLQDEGDSVEDDAEEAGEGYPEDTGSSACPPPATGIPGSSPALPDTIQARPLSDRRPTGRGAALFACLFDAVEQAGGAESFECQKKVDEVQPDDEPAYSVPDQSTSRPRVLGPTLPQSSVPATAAAQGDEGGEGQALPSRPPMDLFKSVFASDEELSDSSVEAGEEAAADGVSTELTEKQSVAIPFRNLFQPTGDVAAPLANLSRITSLSQPAELTSHSALAQPVLAPAAEASKLLHGPLLPPNFETDPVSAPLVSGTNGPNVLLSKTSRDSELQWIEASQMDSLPVTERKKRRHKSKKKKKTTKSHEEKTSRNKRRREKHRKPRGSSASDSGSAASRSSSDEC